MIIRAERRFPVRVRVGVPPHGFGHRYAQMTTWLDENCNSDGRAMTPSGIRGVLNDLDLLPRATIASAFGARWCAGYKVQTAEGVYRVRDDRPLTRTAASIHRTP